VISFTSWSSRSFRRATSETAAPDATSAIAVAAPMPLLAPVTNATVLSRGLSMSVFVVYGMDVVCVEPQLRDAGHLSRQQLGIARAANAHVDECRGIREHRVV
jgi:hypothetical protein